jgi:hypothetical protein
VNAGSSFVHPLSFGGVAAIAGGPFGRLLAYQALVAVIGAAVIAWFIHLAWVPVVDAAIDQLPSAAMIRSGALHYPSAAPGILAENSFLSISVNPAESRTPGTAADIEILLGPRQWLMASFFGHWEFSYLDGWIINLGGRDARAWWGAWYPSLVGGSAVASALALLCGWWFLGIIYAWLLPPVVRILRRSATLSLRWRLCCTALLPGAILMIAAILLYGLHRLQLIGLLIAFALHFVVGWVYVLGALFFLPALPRQGNPFETENTKSRSKKKGKNPFAKTGL